MPRSESHTHIYIYTYTHTYIYEDYLKNALNSVWHVDTSKSVYYYHPFT